MKKHFISLLSFSLLFFFIPSCNGCSGNGGGNGEDSTVVETPPALKGKLVYHRYTSYDAGDSQIWLYDFSTNKLSCISSNWNIHNAMNAQFSPDGTKLVFMGISNVTNMWDIFIYDLTTTAAPTDLTLGSGTRNEDPKFSPDGKRIIFKQHDCLAEITLSTGDIQLLTSEGYSMPSYNSSGTKVVCSKDGSDDSSIVMVDIASKKITLLYDEPNVQDYYPINADESSFYYSRGYSESNRIDQVYRGYWSGLRSKRLPFNGTDGDYSDATPVNSDWVVISSTRTGTRGVYDLYIANVNTGKIYSLSRYNAEINTAKNELGASVYNK